MEVTKVGRIEGWNDGRFGVSAPGGNVETVSREVSFEIPTLPESALRRLALLPQAKT